MDIISFGQLRPMLWKKGTLGAKVRELGLGAVIQRKKKGWVSYAKETRLSM